MKLLILFFICGAFAEMEDLSSTVDPTIIGIEEAPYTVTVLVDGEKAGDGAILSRRYVATAASCKRQNGNISIRAGSNIWGDGGQVIYVEKFYVHPSFKNNGIEGYSFDYGLLFLKKDLQFSETVQPVKLAWADPPNGTMLNITGWHNEGKRYDPTQNKLRNVSLPTIDHRTCKNEYSSEKVFVHENMGCVGSEDFFTTCYADFGGPLVANWTLFGIGTSNYNCGDHNLSSLYSRIPPVFDWYAYYTGQSGGIRNNLAVLAFVASILICFYY